MPLLILMFVCILQVEPPSCLTWSSKAHSSFYTVFFDKFEFFELAAEAKQSFFL